MPLKKELLDVIVCPKCKGDVKEEGMFLTCSACNLAYPILEDVPDMLIEDAWPLEKAKKDGLKKGMKL